MLSAANAVTLLAHDIKLNISLKDRREVRPHPNVCSHWGVLVVVETAQGILQGQVGAP
jgi:hypothetical protein